MKVTILAKDNNKKGNISLSEFLNNNLEKLLKLNFVFDFKIVREKDIKNLVKNGIIGLPAAIVNSKPIIGYPEIKKYFDTYSGNNDKINEDVEQFTISPEEELRMDQMSEMFDDGPKNRNKKAKKQINESDDFSDLGSLLVNRANTMMKQRKEISDSTKKNVNPPKKQNNIIHNSNTLESTMSSRSVTNAIDMNDPDENLWASKFEESM